MHWTHKADCKYLRQTRILEIALDTNSNWRQHSSETIWIPFICEFHWTEKFQEHEQGCRGIKTWRGKSELFEALQSTFFLHRWMWFWEKNINFVINISFQEWQQILKLMNIQLNLTQRPLQRQKEPRDSISNKLILIGKMLCFLIIKLTNILTSKRNLWKANKCFSSLEGKLLWSFLWNALNDYDYKSVPLLLKSQWIKRCEIKFQTQCASVPRLFICNSLSTYRVVTTHRLKNNWMVFQQNTGMHDSPRCNKTNHDNRQLMSSQYDWTLGAVKSFAVGRKSLTKSSAQTKERR